VAMDNIVEVKLVTDEVRAFMIKKGMTPEAITDREQSGNIKLIFDNQVHNHMAKEIIDANSMMVGTAADRETRDKVLLHYILSKSMGVHTTYSYPNLEHLIDMTRCSRDMTRDEVI